MSLLMNANIRICLFYVLCVGVFPVQILKNYGSYFENCGKYHRSMVYYEQLDVILVGGMDLLIRLNMEDLNLTSCRNDTLQAVENLEIGQQCKVEEDDIFYCAIHISILRKVGSGDSIYLCSTNFYHPIVLSIEIRKDDARLDDILYTNRYFVHKVRADTGRCPFNPDANYSAVELDGVAFVGSGVDTDKVHPGISKHTLKVDSKEQAEESYIRTRYDVSFYVNKPQFVASFVPSIYEDHRVYFIFREIAKLKEGVPSTRYISRIGTICIKDEGTYSDKFNFRDWNNYLKVSLKCETEKIKYNEVQHAVVEQMDYAHVLTATFTSQDSQGSAICEYKLSATLPEVFNGSFNSDPTGITHEELKKWCEQNPFNCFKEDEQQAALGSCIDLIRNYPLIYNSFSAVPVYQTKKDTFTKIAFVMHKVDNDNIYSIFAGSTKGEIHQIVFNHHDEIVFHYVLDIIKIIPPEPIRTMLYLGKQKSLYLTSDSAIFRFTLSECEKRFDNCLQCAQDPFCSWNNITKKCVFEGNGIKEKKGRFFSDLCEENVKIHSDDFVLNQTTHIECKSAFISFDILSHVTVAIIWYRCNNNEQPINCGNPEKYSCENDSLIIKSVDEKDAGCYKCKLVNATLYSVEMTLIKPESFVAVWSYTLQVKCHNPDIQKYRIPERNISWFQCGDSSKDDKKIEEKENKYSYKNYSLVISLLSYEDQGCYACKSEIKLLYAFNLRVIKAEPVVAILGQTQQIVCQHPEIQENKNLANNISWFPCSASTEGDNKIKEKENKYSYKNYSLIILSVKNEDAGCYVCKSGTDKSYAVNLTVITHYLTTSGSTASLACKSSLHDKTSNFLSDIGWSKSNDLENFTKIETKTKKYSFQNHILIIESIDSQDEGYYKCKDNETNVIYELKVVFITHYLTTSGSTASLACKSSLHDKTSNFLSDIGWSKSNDLENFTKIETKTKKYSLQNHILIIESIDNQDEGYYKCKDNETYVIYELKVVYVTSQLYGINLNQNATIVCNNSMIRVAKIPVKEISWYQCNDEKNAKKLKNDGIKYSFKNYDLVILSVQKEDMGCYSCKSAEVVLHIANITILSDKPKMGISACGEKYYTLWKYMFFIHVFIMVAKNIF